MNNSTEILVLITLTCLLGTVWTTEGGTESRVNLILETPGAGPSHTKHKSDIDRKGLIVDEIQDYYIKGSCLESAQKKHVKWNQFKSMFKWNRGKDHDITFFGLFLPELKTKVETKHPGDHTDGHVSSRRFSQEKRHSSGSAHQKAMPDYTNEEIKEEAYNHAISLTKEKTWRNGDLVDVIEPSDKIYLVVHGWTESIESLHRIYGLDWMVAVGMEWRHYGRGHVFLVDWRVHADTFYPLTAKKKLKEVAQVILTFLKFVYGRLHLKDNSLTFQRFLDNVEGAGHSLGAHILGIVGFYLKTDNPNLLISVIYGLDPAGFMFGTNIFGDSDDKFFHLNKSSARKVLTLHTQMGLLGIRYASGHYSFYPFVELGYEDWCNSETRPPGCKHLRSINLFIASLKEASHIDHQLIGFKCNEESHFVDRSIVSRFGIHHKNTDPVEKGEGVYFMPIGRCSPYNEIKNKINTKLPLICDVERKIKKFWKVIGKGSVVDVKFTFENGFVARGTDDYDEGNAVLTSSASVAESSDHNEH